MDIDPNAFLPAKIAGCVLLIFFVLLAGCEKPKPATQTPVVPPWPGKMSLKVMPSPPLPNQDSTFRLRLTDESGQPVSRASVKAALVMSTMDMGKNEVMLAERGSGDYVGKGKFTMAGPWNVNVIADDGGKSGQQTFPIVVHRE